MELNVQMVVFYVVILTAFHLAMTTSIRTTMEHLGIQVSGHSWHRAASAALMMTVVFGALHWLSVTLGVTQIARFRLLLELAGVALFFGVPIRVAYRLSWVESFRTGGLALVGGIIILAPLMVVAGLLLSDESVTSIIASVAFAVVLLALVGRSWRQESRFRKS